VVVVQVMEVMVMVRLGGRGPAGAVLVGRR